MGSIRGVAKCGRSLYSVLEIWSTKCHWLGATLLTEPSWHWIALLHAWSNYSIFGIELQERANSKQRRIYVLLLCILWPSIASLCFYTWHSQRAYISSQPNMPIRMISLQNISSLQRLFQDNYCPTNHLVQSPSSSTVKLHVILWARNRVTIPFFFSNFLSIYSIGVPHTMWKSRVKSRINLFYSIL